MAIPDHHKAIARHLLEKFGEPMVVHAYRDNQGKRPIPIGMFGSGKNRFFSTIGICDTSFNIPVGNYEFAALGSHDWLPNAIVSSIYWLKKRTIEDWPLVCEDAVKQNVKSTYRHMVYIPSRHIYQPPSGPVVTWLLGVPIKDSEISVSLDEAFQKARKTYPAWFFEE